MNLVILVGEVQKIQDSQNKKYLKFNLEFSKNQIISCILFKTQNVASRIQEGKWVQIDGRLSVYKREKIDLVINKIEIFNKKYFDNLDDEKLKFKRNLEPEWLKK